MKSIQKALDDNGHIYRAMVDNALDGIFISLDDQFIYINNRLAEITAYSVDELKGMNFFELIHHDDQNWIQQFMLNQESLPYSISNTAEIRILRKDNTIRYCEIVVSPLQFEKKKVTIIFLWNCTFGDILLLNAFEI